MDALVSQKEIEKIKNGTCFKPVSTEYYSQIIAFWLEEIIKQGPWASIRVSFSKFCATNPLPLELS